MDNIVTISDARRDTTPWRTVIEKLQREQETSRGHILNAARCISDAQQTMRDSQTDLADVQLQAALLSLSLALGPKGDCP